MFLRSGLTEQDSDAGNVERKRRIVNPIEEQKDFLMHKRLATLSTEQGECSCNCLMFMIELIDFRKVLASAGLTVGHPRVLMDWLSGRLLEKMGLIYSTNAMNIHAMLIASWNSGLSKLADE